jgi:hypothetical protein
VGEYSFSTTKPLQRLFALTATQVTKFEILNAQFPDADKIKTAILFKLDFYLLSS